MGKTIIYLHPHFTAYGGAGRFVLESGRRLANRGHKIKVISIQSDMAIVGEYQKDIEFIDIGGPLSSNLCFWLFFPWSYSKIYRILKDNDDFILFSQVFPANWWGALYKLFHKNTRLVWMCQEPSAFIHSKEWVASIKNPFMRLGARIFNPLLKTVDIKLAALPDLVIANSEYTRRYAQAVYKYSADNIRTVYIGVDSPSNVYDKRINNGIFTVITVARLTKFKNIGIIIKALKVLIDKGYSVCLAVVGNGEELENLKHLSESLNLGKSVRFYGSITQPELDRLYKESHVYVSASLQEPYGMALLEAMSYGLPVIAVNSGGPSETVIDNKTGFLVSDRDQYLIAEKIAKLLNDKELYGQLSKNSKTRANEFSWDRTIDEMLIELLC